MLLFSKLSNTCNKELSARGVNSNHQRSAGAQWLSTVAWVCLQTLLGDVWGLLGDVRPNVPLTILARGAMGLTDPQLLAGHWSQTRLNISLAIPDKFSFLTVVCGKAALKAAFSQIRKRAQSSSSLILRMCLQFSGLFLWLI